MNPVNPPSFYDVEPLAHWMQAGVPVVTPNYRLARHISYAWALWQQRAGIEAWEPPLVLSVEQWWLHCHRQADPWSESPRALATETQEIELWLRCIRENPASDKLLRPLGAARAARDAYRNLQLWQLDWRVDPLAQQFSLSGDSELFRQWAQRFDALCATLKLELLPNLVPGLARRMPCDAMVLVEVDELPPLYETCLKAQIVELHRYQQRPGSEPTCRLQPCQDEEEELYCAARWAGNILREEPAASVAILLPDLERQRYRFERILREVLRVPEAAGEPLPANFSGGVPLAATATVSCALGLLALHRTDIETESLVRLLHSRYRGRGPGPAEFELVQTLYRHGRATISAGRLRYLCRDMPLGEQLQALARKRELKRKHPPSAWSDLLADYLQTLRWPGSGPLDSHEYQQLEHWQDCLAQLGELDEICGPLDFSAAVSLLGQLCNNLLFQVQTDNAPLQVLGMLEAAGLQFRHLWITGMNSEDWPAPASPNPFIPFALQKQHGMPHADSAREYHFAQRLLEQYRHGARELVASFALVRDEVRQRPSALVARYPALAQPQPAGTPVHWSENSAQELEWLPIEIQAPPLDDGEASRLSGGSSLVEDQSHCGFRAYVQHRLKTRSNPELAAGLTPADRGTLVHDALHHLWGNLAGSNTLKALSAEERENLVNSAAADTLDRFTSKNPDLLGPNYLQLEQTQLCRLLMHWLQIEMQRGPFEIEALEAERDLELDRLRLRLRIDRIDRLPNGDLFIIDYKTGAVNVGYWLGPRPRQPQLPLYAEALGDAVGGLAFALLRPGEVSWSGLARSAICEGVGTDIARATARLETPLADWQGLRESWRQTLQELARQFISGEVRVDPLDRNTSCRYCGLQPLCRIGEVGDRGGA